MKFRIPTLLVCALASQAALHAQDKPKTTNTPKVLVFPSSTKQPQAMAEAPERPPASPANVPDAIAQIVAVFFGSLGKGEVDQAWNVLGKGSKRCELPGALKELKIKTEEAIADFGAIVDYDLVDAKSVGNRLVRATYISNGKVNPLRWRFYFYKPADNWLLLDISIDPRITALFDEPEDAKNPKIGPP
jgi:hypothetical protein